MYDPCRSSHLRMASLPSLRPSLSYVERESHSELLRHDENYICPEDVGESKLTDKRKQSLKEYIPSAEERKRLQGYHFTDDTTMSKISSCRCAHLGEQLARISGRYMGQTNAMEKLRDSHIQEFCPWSGSVRDWKFVYHRFHFKPNPSFDHFQLKNLTHLDPLSIENHCNVFYLQEATSEGLYDKNTSPFVPMSTHSSSREVAVFSYNFGTSTTKQVLGPWNYPGIGGTDNGMGLNKSSHIFALGVSEHYLAIAGGVDCILLAHRSGLSIDWVTACRLESSNHATINSLTVLENPEISIRASTPLLTVIQTKFGVNMTNFHEAADKEKNNIEHNFDEKKFCTLLNSIAREGNAYITKRLTEDESHLYFEPLVHTLTRESFPHVIVAGNDGCIHEYGLVLKIGPFPEGSYHAHYNTINSSPLCFGTLMEMESYPWMHPKLHRIRTWRFSNPINQVAVHPMGDLILAMGDNSSSYLLSRSLGPMSPDYTTQFSDAASMYWISGHSFAAAWHPNGYIFAAGSEERIITIHDLRRGKNCPLSVLVSEVTACRSLSFSPDGRFLLSCESEESIVIYSGYPYFTQKQVIPFFGGCTGAVFSPDGGTIYIGIGASNNHGGFIEIRLLK